jgi:Tfp pilus assembly protein PilV
LMPEFAVIMTADRREAVRWPVAIVLTDSGQVIPLDRKTCHPSDASSLLSGRKVSEMKTLIDALDSAVHGMVDGSRVASALRAVQQLRRICRNDL